MIYGEHLPLFKEVFGKIAKWKHKGVKGVNGLSIDFLLLKMEPLRFDRGCAFLVAEQELLPRTFLAAF